MVFHDETVQWSAITIESLDDASFSLIVNAKPAIEILLIGCGERMKLIDSNVLAYVKSAGIAVEPMDTGAACRTFNLLIAEDRRVAAALIPVA